MAGAVLRASRKGCGAPGRRGPRLLSVWQAQYLEPLERVAARLVAVGRGCCLCGRRSTWSLQSGAPGRRGRSTWSSRKGCGAPGRRGPRLRLCGRRSTWNLPARLVAAGRGSCLCGRRSTWSLQKGLRRAWSPWAAAPVRVAGAIFGASRKGCGAPGRRGPRLLSVRRAQYSEPPEKVAARLVAVGRGCCLCGRRNTWSLQKGLRRACSPWAAAPVCVAGAVFGASRNGLAACCV